jgi:hypothetical protein
VLCDAGGVDHPAAVIVTVAAYFATRRNIDLGVAAGTGSLILLFSASGES